MKRNALALVLGGLIVFLGGIAAVDAASAEKTVEWICSLTGKTVEQCCCEPQKDGKLYCTLAKQTVDPCCCKAVDK